MKIWKISQDETADWDTFDSAVVAADTEMQAKEIHPGGDDRWKNDWCSMWASSPDNVKCECVGEAKEGTTAGVICSSFNAG